MSSGCGRPPLTCSSSPQNALGRVDGDHNTTVDVGDRFQRARLETQLEHTGFRGSLDAEIELPGIGLVPEASRMPRQPLHEPDQLPNDPIGLLCGFAAAATELEVRAVATTASSRMQHDHRVAEGFGHRVQRHLREDVEIDIQKLSSSLAVHDDCRGQVLAREC
jgi:hypothetical protein